MRSGVASPGRGDARPQGADLPKFVSDCLLHRGQPGPCSQDDLHAWANRPDQGVGMSNEATRRRHAWSSRAWSLAATVGSALALATPATAAPIIGGTATTVGQYPSVVAITVGGSLCTGTLITPLWVLTAAHCIDPVVLEMASQDAVTADTRVHFKTVDVRRSPGTIVKAVATIKDAQF